MLFYKTVLIKNSIKVLQKAQVVSFGQQRNVMNERNVMIQARS